MNMSLISFLTKFAVNLLNYSLLSRIRYQITLENMLRTDRELLGGGAPPRSSRRLHFQNKLIT